MSQSFSNKSVLVTGGGSGIGLATAKRFASLGAKVTICGRTEAKLAAAAAEIEAAAESGGTASFIAADVTIEDQLAAAVDLAASVTSGHLDVAFGCAGGAMHMGSIVDADADGVRATIDLNLAGSFLTVKHAARAMGDGGGSIVLMSSGAGHFPHRWLWAYGMSKAGIESLTAYAAEELGATGIRVNAVQPGIINDELMSFITAGGALLDDYISQMPLGRLGEVDDVAAAVTFLASDEASFITGATLPIDGGHHLRRGANYQLLFS